jgi:hypothetical protein
MSVFKSRLDAERFRRLHADARGVRIVVVFVYLEDKAGFLKRKSRGREFGHGLRSLLRMRRS